MRVYILWTVVFTLACIKHFEKVLSYSLHPYPFSYYKDWGTRKVKLGTRKQSWARWEAQAVHFLRYKAPCSGKHLSKSHFQLPLERVVCFLPEAPSSQLGSFFMSFGGFMWAGRELKPSPRSPNFCPGNAVPSLNYLCFNIAVVGDQLASSPEIIIKAVRWKY